MGGWMAMAGEPADFDQRLERFKRIFSVDGVPPLMVEVKPHTPGFRTMAWAWSRSGVPEVLVEKIGDTALVFCGVLTGLGRLGPLPPDQASAVRLVLETWLTAGGDFPIDQLNGSFSLVFFDEQTGRMTAYTDRFASRSVWFTQENGTWLAGNFPSALAVMKKDSPRINPVGLWSLLHTARHVGGQGLYDGVNCLSAGETAGLSPGRPAEVRRWKERRYRPDYGLSPRAWGKRIASVLKESARAYDRVCTSPHLFMSGGLDSRIAAAAFGPPLKSISLCNTPNAETRLAALASKVIGIEHQAVVRSPYWYLDTLDAAALISSGSYQTTHAHFIVHTSDTVARTPGAEFLLGDLLENFNKHYFTVPPGVSWRFDPGRIVEVLHSFVPYSLKDQSRLGAFIRPDLRQSIREKYFKAMEEYAQSLLDVSEDDADRLDTLLRWADVSLTPTYNMITCFWPLTHQRNIFFDNRVYDLALGIPSKLRGAGILHRWTLHYLNPLLPLIPNANTWLPPIAPSAAGKITKRIRPTLGKTRRNLLSMGRPDRPVLVTSGSWSLSQQLYRKDARYQMEIERIIKDESNFPDDIFHREEIERTWTRYLQGETSHHFEIDSLLSFGALQGLIKFDGLSL